MPTQTAQYQSRDEQYSCTRLQATAPVHQTHFRHTHTVLDPDQPPRLPQPLLNLCTPDSMQEQDGRARDKLLLGGDAAAVLSEQGP